MFTSRFSQMLVAASCTVLLAFNAHAEKASAQPSNKLLQHVAKIDACAMALDQVDKKLSQALQIKAEILMNSYYTDEVDALPDSEYNQIAWVKTYNGYFLEEQQAFFQHGSPEFAKVAAKQNYQKNCIELSKTVLKSS